MIGYYADLDTCPMMLVLPTLVLAEDFSKDRIDSLFSATPCLRDAISDQKTRDSSNTILRKAFRGGAGDLAIAGANSPTSLSSKPRRIVLMDEVARFAVSSGAEGDPVTIVGARTANFWNALEILTSTPTIKDACRIEAALLDTDLNRWHVPCNWCGEAQHLEWKTATGGVRWIDQDPRTAVYRCSYCEKDWDDDQRITNMCRGDWIPDFPERSGLGVIGFHTNALISPWVELWKLVVQWYKAQNDPAKLKPFVNLVLGETFEEKGDHSDPTELQARAESYEPGLVPPGCAVIVIGVDTQDDRLEAEVVGFGRHRESWGLEKVILRGDPSGQKVWEALDNLISRTWKTPTGHEIPVSGVCVDSGGHRTTDVYDYCKSRFGQRVWAIKGKGGPGVPLLGAPTRNNVGKVHLFPVGSDTVKNLLHGLLQLETPGPGYCHFPTGAGYDREFFLQLTAEHAVTKWKNGVPFKVWRLRKAGNRNEALDCRCYALAALDGLGIDLDHACDLLSAAEDRRRLDLDRGRKSKRSTGDEGRGTPGWRPDWLG